MRHDLIDQRSLAFNRLIVEKIRQQPGLMQVVRENLAAALGDPGLSASCKDALGEWDLLVRSRPTGEVLDLLIEESTQGQRLRHSTPFWGILTPQERRIILREYESAGT